MRKVLVFLCACVFGMLLFSACSDVLPASETTVGQANQENATAQASPGVEVTYNGEKVGKIVISDNTPQFVPYAGYQVDRITDSLEDEEHQKTWSIRVYKSFTHVQIDLKFKGTTITWQYVHSY